MTNERRDMQAESIRIETDERGFVLLVDDEESVHALRIADPEALYDHVKAAILPWLMERDAAKIEYDMEQVERGVVLDVERYGHVAGWRDPIYHSVHADLYDARAGK